MLPSGARYTIYPWSYSHVYPPQYWSPQNIVPNLTTSQGHLELSAAAGGTALGTFSRAALASMHAALGPTPDPPNAFKDYGDGSTTVLFDRDGVKNRSNGIFDMSARPNLINCRTILDLDRRSEALRHN